MKKSLLSFIIPLLTFAGGVFIYRIFIPKTTLSDITNNISIYNGKTVEIETFLLTQRVDEFLWTITDFEENPSAVTVVYFENDSIKPSFLIYKNNKDQIKKAKVLIKGKILDNCNIDGKSSCCLFKAITIEAQEVKLLSPVEDYSSSE